MTMSYKDFENRLLRENEVFNAPQKHWAQELYDVWLLVNEMARGGGKSFFWIRFISFLQRTDRGVHLWMEGIARAKYASGELGYYDRVTKEWTSR